MKTKNLLAKFFLFVLIFSCQTANAKQCIINQEGPGLELSSKITFNGERISNYTIILYNEDQTSDTIEVSGMKLIYMKLSYGHTYALRFIKKGFLERVMLIDTHLEKAKQSKEMQFDFEIEMIPVGKNGNTLSDLPVALVGYDAEEKNFDYSRNYHRQVRGKEIKEVED